MADEIKDPKVSNERGPGEPAPVVKDDTFGAQVTKLFNDSFVGTALANHTDLWNMVVKFRDDVINLK